MKLEHIGLYVRDLENMKSFYEKYFQAKAGELYQNFETDFSSYFLTFEEGARLELCTMTKLPRGRKRDVTGYMHLALSVGSAEKVDQMAVAFASAGLKILSGPRRTGDGYYELVIYDPEKNLIEITV